jgi:hypothetical protein
MKLLNVRYRNSIYEPNLHEFEQNELDLAKLTLCIESVTKPRIELAKEKIIRVEE